MKSALRSLQKGNVGIVVLKEKNLIGGIQTHYSTVYKVWETEAESRHLGRTAIVWRGDTGSQVKGATIFGLNLVSFTITAGRK